MASRKQIAFKHAFDSMLTEHLHDSTVRSQLSAIRVFREIVRNPELLADCVDVVQLVGSIFVGTEDAKVVHIQFHYVAEERAQRTGVFCSISSQVCRLSRRTVWKSGRRRAFFRRPPLA